MPTPRRPRALAGLRLLAAALPLLAAACGSGGGSGSGSGGSTGAVAAAGPADQQTVTVSMRDSLKFQPDTVTAKVGTLTLTIPNSGQVPHNLVFDDSALGKTGTVAGKETATLKVVFRKPGTYQFVCTFHPGMDGKVVVS